MIQVTLLITAVGLFSTVNSKPQSLCPGTTESLDVETTTACFRFVQEEIDTYFKASDLCKKSQGLLASITSREENYALIKKLQEVRLPRKFWIGMNNKIKGTENKVRKFAWLDGSPVTFEFWAGSQGSPSTKFKCVVLDNTESNNGRWYDTSCWSKETVHPGYICKYTRHTLTTTTTTTKKPTQKLKKTTKIATMTTKASTTMTTDLSDSKTTKEPFGSTTVPIALTTDLPTKTASGSASTVQTTMSLSTMSTTIPPTVTEMDPNLFIADEEECIFDCPFLDCGMDGYKFQNNCQLCECNDSD